ncbi:plasmid mobilization relaxosome protein MobC [Streptomyces jumonjinensis]|nr:plasmid mobilization relaxosome protein MobC [Streptomyces jumonjinensis]
MSDDMPRARRRERRADQPRRHRVNLAYNDRELAILMSAAAVAGLKPAAYAARVALAVAKEEVSPAPVEYKDRLREMTDSRIAVNRIGTNLNQIAKELNSDAEVSPAQLAAILTRVEEAIRRLDAATIAVMEGRA